MHTTYRHEIPVDDELHTLVMTSNAWPQTFATVAPRTPEEKWKVEFWAEHDDSLGQREFTYQVFGTGHAIGTHDQPSYCYHYVGTAARHHSGLVFHVYEFIAES